MSYLFKVDAFLSLVYVQVPHMQPKDLDILVLQAFGRWNTCGRAMAVKWMTATHSRCISQHLISRPS